MPGPDREVSRQSDVFREPGREGGKAFLLCDGMRRAGPGSGLSPRSVNELPHDEVRDGPRYVSKRNSSVNDCRAHIAVVLMSHVPVDAPAAREAADSFAAPTVRGPAVRSGSCWHGPFRLERSPAPPHRVQHHRQLARDGHIRPLEPDALTQLEAPAAQGTVGARPRQDMGGRFIET